MDIISILVGIVVGLIIGFAIAWSWSTAVSKAKHKANNVTEAQLKALLAQQAQSHLQHSRTSLDVIESELQALRTSVNNYENNLQNSDEDQSGSAFFGEHASVFLRNTQLPASKTKLDLASEDQPRDFANNGSGLFVGSPADDVNNNSSENIKEKANN